MIAATTGINDVLRQPPSTPKTSLFIAEMEQVWVWVCDKTIKTQPDGDKWVPDKLLNRNALRPKQNTLLATVILTRAFN